MWRKNAEWGFAAIACYLPLMSEALTIANATKLSIERSRNEENTILP